MNYSLWIGYVIHPIASSLYRWELCEVSQYNVMELILYKYYSVSLMGNKSMDKNEEAKKII